MKNSDDKSRAAGTGNASNPDPQQEPASTNGSQLLNDKAGKYIREVASIEDLPDANDQQEMDDEIDEDKSKI
jgi:hypothetical protein